MKQKNNKKPASDWDSGYLFSQFRLFFENSFDSFAKILETF